MFRMLSFVGLAVSLMTAPPPQAKGGGHRSGGDVRVRGYVRKDGTYVAPHMRSRPDGNPFNNWSTIGNVNPYTLEPGTKHPELGRGVVRGSFGGTFSNPPPYDGIGSATGTPGAGTVSSGHATRKEYTPHRNDAPPRPARKFKRTVEFKGRLLEPAFAGLRPRIGQVWGRVIEESGAISPARGELWSLLQELKETIDGLGQSWSMNELLEAHGLVHELKSALEALRDGRGIQLEE